MRTPTERARAEKRAQQRAQLQSWGVKDPKPPLPPKPAKVKPKPQALAAAKLAHARRQVGEVTKRIKRATTSLRLWENRASYYAKRASMTDAELDAERARKARKPTKPTRLYSDEVE